MADAAPAAKMQCADCRHFEPSGAHILDPVSGEKHVTGRCRNLKVAADWVFALDACAVWEESGAADDAGA